MYFRRSLGLHLNTDLISSVLFPLLIGRMTNNMAKPQKINFKDRISNLSRDVMECIMEFLPVRDAARTCVLSSKWRYVWADHPSLVLDMGFWKHIQRHISRQKFNNIHKANIVSSILLHHVGFIRKFVIDVSVLSSINVDVWLSSLCRRSLKVLDLKNSDHSNRYKVPFSVLSTSELTHLSLSFCNIKEAIGCFTNIQSLILEDVNFDLVILTTPLLTSLTMRGCYGNFGFDISAPRLASLTLEDNEFLNLQLFFMCTDIDYAFLFSHRYYVEGDGKHLVELLAFWPKISVLVVDGFSFKHLATGSIPDNDISLLNLRRFALRDVNLDSEKIAWILYILKSSPLLQTFEIWFGEDVMNDIDEPSMKDFKMDQLRTVKMKDFTATRNELMFVKILLKCAPLLGKLLVEENQELDPNERMEILKELLLLQRINPKTEIIFAPNLVPV